MDYQPQFADFLDKVEHIDLETNTTATGAFTVQQSQRNLLRKEGIAAFKADLQWLYGDQFDVVETKDGICVVAENESTGYSFTWEIKSTIKSLDYDAFISANEFDEAEEEKAHKKEIREKEKEAKLKATELKRQKKLAEIEAKKNK